MNPRSLGVSIMCLSEINLHWKMNHLTQQFKSILKKACPTNKITIYISKSGLPFTSDFKLGGTTLATLKPISSSITSKEHDHWGLEKWTYITILGEELQQTTLFNVYRPCKDSIESTGCTIVVKQQWLLMQRDNHT